jgi:hypothetical protein
MDPVELSIKQEPDAAMKSWIQQEVEQEKAALQSRGAKAISLRVKNCSIAIDSSKPKAPTAVNRVEIDTGFNFELLEQVEFTHEDYGQCLQGVSDQAQLPFDNSTFY